MKKEETKIKTTLETQQRNGAVQRQNPPCRGRKNGEPDLEEKFGRFEIKPPNRRVQSGMTAGFSSEQGDETVSMVSDTWSTDVLGQ